MKTQEQLIEEHTKLVIHELSMYIATFETFDQEPLKTLKDKVYLIQGSYFILSNCFIRGYVQSLNVKEFGKEFIEKLYESCMDALVGLYKSK